MGIAKDYDYITYEEFLNYRETADIKMEYSNGYIYYMSPTHPNHNYIQNEIYFQLRNILKKASKCKVTTSDVAVRFEDDNIKHQFEPDIMVQCDNKFDESIYTGIPTLIVEVLSRATRERDLGLKLDIYQKFGVKEYWIVDINEREITVYKNNVSGKYKVINIYNEDSELTWNGSLLNIKEIFDSIN